MLWEQQTGLCECKRINQAHQRLLNKLCPNDCYRHAEPKWCNSVNRFEPPEQQEAPLTSESAAIHVRGHCSCWGPLYCSSNSPHAPTQVFKLFGLVRAHFRLMLGGATLAVTKPVLLTKAMFNKLAFNKYKSTTRSSPACCSAMKPCLTSAAET